MSITSVEDTNSVRIVQAVKFTLLMNFQSVVAFVLLITSSEVRLHVNNVSCLFS